MLPVSDEALLNRARDAAERRAWDEAYEMLSAADFERALGLDELHILAEAAYLDGHPHVALETWERIHRSGLADGDTFAAAEAAVRVCDLLTDVGEFATLRGWIRRAHELLAELPESSAHGRLSATEAFAALVTGDADTALALGRQAFDIGVRVDDRGSQALGRNIEARALIIDGHVHEGLRMLDETTIAATSGDLDPFAATIVYCSAVCAAQAVADYERAEAWTREMERMLRRVSVGSFHGWCRVHGAEIKRLRGEWVEAEADAARASEEVRAYVVVERGWPLYELGLVRLRMGNLAGAENAFTEAHSLGWDPQPGLALLRLARGEVETAASAIRTALEHPSRVPSWERPPNTDQRLVPLHEARVEIGVAAGDAPGVRGSADELRRIAATTGTKALKALAVAASGEVELLDGDVDAAIGSFQQAVALWSELVAPYESARARMRLAAAYQAAGILDAAAVEVAAAKTTFDRLGARIDVGRAGDTAAKLGADVPEASPRRKVFLFTDIVGSTELVELIGDDAWRHLLRWHNTTIERLVLDHGGTVVRTTGDGFFATFGHPERAVACAVAIQAVLQQHRTEHGFAPLVRIGAHETLATPEGDDWHGVGVHVAARIGALGEAEQILVSRETGERAGPSFTLSQPRHVPVKGIKEPLEIVEVRWR
jgi:class 3 adenylate cyclase